MHVLCAGRLAARRQLPFGSHLRPCHFIADSDASAVVSHIVFAHPILPYGQTVLAVCSNASIDSATCHTSSLLGDDHQNHSADITETCWRSVAREIHCMIKRKCCLEIVWCWWWWKFDLGHIRKGTGFAFTSRQMRSTLSPRPSRVNPEPPINYTAALATRSNSMPACPSNCAVQSSSSWKTILRDCKSLGCSILASDKFPGDRTVRAASSSVVVLAESMPHMTLLLPKRSPGAVTCPAKQPRWWTSIRHCAVRTWELFAKSSNCRDISSSYKIGALSLASDTAILSTGTSLRSTSR